jgi:hypothetical protein
MPNLRLSISTQKGVHGNFDGLSGAGNLVWPSFASQAMALPDPNPSFRGAIARVIAY